MRTMFSRAAMTFCSSVPTARSPPLVAYVWLLLAALMGEKSKGVGATHSRSGISSSSSSPSSAAWVLRAKLKAMASDRLSLASRTKFCSLPATSSACLWKMRTSVSSLSSFQVTRSLRRLSLRRCLVFFSGVLGFSLFVWFGVGAGLATGLGLAISSSRAASLVVSRLGAGCLTLAGSGFSGSARMASRLAAVVALAASGFVAGWAVLGGSALTGAAFATGLTAGRDFPGRRVLPTHGLFGTGAGTGVTDFVGAGLAAEACGVPFAELVAIFLATLVSESSSRGRLTGSWSEATRFGADASVFAVPGIGGFLSGTVPSGF